MATKYQSFAKRDSLQQRIDEGKRMLGREEHQRGIAHVGVIADRIKTEEAKLAKVTPPSVDGEERVALRQRQGKLEEAIIGGVPGMGIASMPTKQQMWDNGAGDANQHYQHEQYIKNHNLDEGGKLKRINPRKGEQGLWEEWKDNQRTLGKEQEEYATDIASIETLRPDKRDKSDFNRYSSRSHSPYANMTLEQVSEITGNAPTDIETLAELVETPTPAEHFNKVHASGDGGAASSIEVSSVSSTGGNLDAAISLENDALAEHIEAGLCASPRTDGNLCNGKATGNGKCMVHSKGD